MSRLVAVSVVLAAMVVEPAPGGRGPSPGLHVAPFQQRRADRYTQRDGIPAGRVTRLLVNGEMVMALADGGAARFTGGRWVADSGEALRRPRFPLIDQSLLPPGSLLFDAARAPDGTVWLVTDRGPFRLANGRLLPVGFPKTYLTGQPAVNSDASFSCVAVDAVGTVWWGTDVGIFATDGADYWNAIDRGQGLPYEDVTCLAPAPRGDLWVGTTEGVCRFAAGRWHYYWGPRWLPHNRVNAIAVDSDGAAWVATDGGVARLYEIGVSLSRKAAHYQSITDQRHNRRGYVTGCRLKQPGKVDGDVVHEASDNDGLWTALYIAAQSFRYAATRDASARAAARRSMSALLDLLRYTGIPGYPARAVIRRGEEVDGYNPEETVRVEGETDKIWFPSPVDPEVLCKGDTSSDELDGHFFAWHVYHDLAADAAHRRAVRDAVRETTDHLLEHDLTLVGHTGRRTRWGVWHPRFLNDDPVWWEERGLNALEILAYLKIASHVVGDERYAAKYRDLIQRHHYLLNTVTQKVAEPWHVVNHSDDEMSFMMYYSLLRLEQDPDIRRVLLQSLERSWGVDRPEASPFFNFVYGASTGQTCDLEASVAALQEWPWELVDWQARGTHRHDVELRRWHGERQSRVETTRALPANERRLMRWNGNPYQPDGGTPEGRHEEDGSAWLLAYWLGRHHGLIRE